MKPRNPRVLAINGSSSIKFALYQTGELMIARSVWRVERTALERKVLPRAGLAIEGATA